jgi:Protein of unknown function (DUF4245)
MEPDSRVCHHAVQYVGAAIPRPFHQASFEFNDVELLNGVAQHFGGRVAQTETAQQHSTGAGGQPAERSFAGGLGRVHRECTVDDQFIDLAGRRLAAPKHDFPANRLSSADDRGRLHGAIVGIWKDGSVARARKPATIGDLVRSLAVILIPLVVLTVLFTELPKDHPVEVVDPQPVLAKARQEAPYPVLAPANLPRDWRPIRVDWVPQGQPYLNGEPSVRNMWRLGYLNPDDIYIAVIQGDLEVDDFISAETGESVVDGQGTVAGQIWERRVSPDDRTRFLVRREPSVTTIVEGDTSYAALEAFAATLTSS